MTTIHALSVVGVQETSCLTVYFEKDDYIMENYQYQWKYKAQGVNQVADQIIVGRWLLLRNLSASGPESRDDSTLEPAPHFLQP